MNPAVPRPPICDRCQLINRSFDVIGNVKTTWSFSALHVLIYYAITNMAAINMSERGHAGIPGRSPG